MSTAWSPFLEAIGATATADGAHFDDEPLDEQRLDETLLCPLPGYDLLAVSGPDSERFLQGQLTCDASNLAGRATHGAHCNPKGRVLSSFLLAGLQDQYRLRLRGDIREQAQAVLGKYILFSKAELQAAPGDPLVWGLSGPGAAALLADTLQLSPAGELQLADGDGVTAVQLDEAGRRFELWVSAERSAALWQQLVATARPAASAYWHWQRIRAGVADLNAATREELLPQMLNYDLIGAVNFRKGCYTGQEVVARAHYRGKVKRRLYRLAAPGPASAGDEVLEAETGRGVGLVVDAVAISATRSELLAVIATGAADKALQIGESGPTATPLPLPYAINDKE